MRNRPTTEFRLCLETKLLCDSHLLPAGAYRPLMTPGPKGAEPPVHVGVNHRKPLKSSRQIKDYLLYEGCEDRLRRQGEDWMTANGYHADGSFPLRDAALKKGASFRGEEGTFIYETRGNLAIKMELGPYREPLRLFLLNEGSLPDELCLIVGMASVGYFGRTLGLPISEKHGAFRGHHFTACGISASLYVGKMIPEYFFLESAFPKGILTINKHFDNKQLGLVVEHVKENYAHLIK
jgi:hypothetical protein